MVRPGRPPLPRNVYSFDAADTSIPDVVTLDSSFVVNALFSAEKNHEAARQFLESLAGHETRLVFNHLLELELHEAAFRYPLIQKYPKDWRRRRYDGRSLRRAQRLISKTIDAWHELLGAFTYTVVSLDAVSTAYPEIMYRYGLQSYDAVHAATALEYGNGVIVTTDAGFANVAETSLTVYIDSGRVPWCRGVRQRRAKSPSART